MPRPKNTAASRSHKFGIIASQVPYGQRELLQVLGKRKLSPYLHSVITKSWSEVMIRLSTTNRRPILGRSSPLSRQKKDYFPQEELYNHRILTTCELLSKTSKCFRWLQRVIGIKKIHKIALLPQHNNSWTKTKWREHSIIGSTLIPFLTATCLESSCALPV